MTVSAPQIKAYLEEIKKDFLDSDERKLEDYILCLICLEILQRGVIVSPTIHDPSKILVAARDAAGKTLLDGSSPIPKPVLAGSAVIAGRIAESASKSCRSSSWKDVGFLKKDVQAVIKRCGDVDDKRLEGILSAIIYQPISENDVKPLQFLLVVAEGYYYRSASFQPDAPPMWKRAWDVAVERHKTESRADILQNLEAPWEIVVPLEQLCRIASSKGNGARVTELSLILAESVLDASHAPESNDSLGRLLREQFIAPYRSILPYDRSEAIRIASDVLKKVGTPAEASADHFAWSVLELRLQLDQEATEISSMAKMLQTKAVNRGDPALSVEKYFTMAQQKVLAGILFDDLLLAKAARVTKLICDTLTRGDKDEASSYRFRQACILAGEKVCDRLTMRAKSIALSMKKSVELMMRVWQEILSYIFPILTSLRHQCNWSHMSDENDRISAVRLFLDSTMTEYKSICEHIACLCPLAEWMSQGMLSEDQVDSDLQFDRETLVLVRDILAVLHSGATAGQNENRETAVASVVGSKERRVKKLEVNMACCSNMLALSGNYLGETPRSVVERAIKRLNRLPDDDSSVEFDGSGLFCLDFFICWWGLQRVPWTFCTLPESRSIVKRARWAFNILQEKWGRPMTLLERCLVDLGEADSEGIYFSGGLPVIAKSGYQRVLSEAEQLPNDTVKQLLVAVSTSGLAAVRFMQSSVVVQDSTERIEGFVLDALHLSMKLRNDGHSRKLHLWTDESTVRASLEFQIAALRQFSANILIKNGDYAGAAALLEEAVQDAPDNVSAAIALGTYRLRIMLFGKEVSPEDTKAAHVQLMKAARLDSSSSEPFALLGYWYERMGDKQRAVGCYTKALLLEPSQPVAGRGLLRLAHVETLESSLAKAVNIGSPLSGWAWRVTAAQKAQREGRDDLAVLAYLNCLRCRDIDRPQTEPHGIFFADPTNPRHATSDEKSAVLGELATCYRRLGRFTAAIRTFHVAIGESGENVLPSIYCGCGQAELELGLYDQANENFRKAAQVADSTELAWAMYGQGMSFLALAQRDFHHGKIGLSFQMLKQGITACNTSFQQLSVAFNKLLGDIYTFGAYLPSDVFVEHEGDRQNEIECKLAFVAKGETAYSQALETHTEWEGEDMTLLQTSLFCDLATNKLIRAQFLSSTGCDIDKGRQLFEEAAEGFRCAIDIHPQYSTAWCGLGASVFKSDPLLSQHAFCRSIDLESQFQDAYANLSFLYTENDVFSQSAKVSDALTQIADTPMMWINRALILEREVASNPNSLDVERQLSQAADAYMASLQVERNPTAILGASITKRASLTSSRDNSSETHFDSLCLSTEYYRGLRSDDARASLFHQLLLWEVKGLENIEHGDGSVQGHSQRRIQSGIQKPGLEIFSKDFIQSIESFIEQPPKVEETYSGFHHPDQANLSSTRKIVHDPKNGELWLALAKELISQSQGENTQENYEAALTASTRAVYILRSKLGRSTDSPRSSAQVNAEDLSNALSLKFWLENIDEGASASESLSRTNHEALQMSLMMFPNNVIAREALKLHDSLLSGHRIE